MTLSRSSDSWVTLHAKCNPAALCSCCPEAHSQSSPKVETDEHVMVTHLPIWLGILASLPQTAVSCATVLAECSSVHSACTVRYLIMPACNTWNTSSGVCMYKCQELLDMAYLVALVGSDGMWGQPAPIFCFFASCLAANSAGCKQPSITLSMQISSFCQNEAAL